MGMDDHFVFLLGVICPYITTAKRLWAEDRFAFEKSISTSDRDLFLFCHLLLLPLVQDHVDQGQEDYRRKEWRDYEYHAVYDVTP